MFKEQVLRCWKKPYGYSDQQQRIEAEFSIKLKKDGTLEAMPVAQTTPSDAFQRVFQESGLRAIVDCAPYRLPPGFFDEWKFFNPVFDSSEL
jgi:colicin import membrane protein